MKKSIFLILVFALPILSTHAQIVRINEFMASNSAIVDPDFGQPGDWIELYNTSASTVNLGGYFLTNDLSAPAVWAFPPGTTLGANQYLLVWADEANTGLHAGFSLSSGGGEIGLFDPAGAPIDNIIFDAQAQDVSFGRLGSSAQVWRYFDTPTPGTANASSGFIGLAEEVTFSSAGGFFVSPVTLSLSTVNAENTIRYTIDGAPPTETSTEYTGPINVLSTRVVRAAAFRDGVLPGPVATHSYFINDPTDLPVVSIAIDPDNLWSDETGMYVAGTNGIPGPCDPEPKNYNQNWEYAAHMEFYEADRTPILNQGIGLKIFGGCSRAYDQKSLSVHARDVYGKERFAHRFFEDRESESFSSLVLRNSGQDWFRTMFRDGMIQTLLAADTDIDLPAYRPAIVFLNGEYFGLHNIRELLDAGFIETNHGFNEHEIDLLDFDGGLPTHGDNLHYNAMIEFITNSDLTLDASMAFVETQMDVDQYLDYMAAEIYIANADWPSGNNKFWRPRAADGRWRWMMFDTDLSFGGNENGLATSNTIQQATEPNGPVWPNPPWSTLLFRRLLENEGFKNRFVQRISSHINVTFDSTHVHHVIDSLRTRIAGEITRHKARWPESIGFSTLWSEHIDLMNDFATERPAHLRQHLTDHFGLSGLASLAISNTLPEGGRVFVSDVLLRSAEFSGMYFTDIPIELRAEPNEGYRFVGWAGDFSASQDVAEITLSAATSIEAVFEPVIVSTEEEGAGFRFELGQNYPNPVATSTVIPFEIPTPGHVSVRVYDLLGRVVTRVFDNDMAAGKHQARIEVESLASGVYFYELTAGGRSARRKMVVVE